eukprot:5929894-Pyramimonas_sp.AAC.1
MGGAPQTPQHAPSPDGGRHHPLQRRPADDVHVRWELLCVAQYESTKGSLAQGILAMMVATAAPYRIYALLKSQRARADLYVRGQHLCGSGLL